MSKQDMLLTTEPLLPPPITTLSKTPGQVPSLLLLGPLPKFSAPQDYRKDIFDGQRHWPDLEWSGHLTGVTFIPPAALCSVAGPPKQ